jgi:glycogen(starch) synthase
MRVLHLFHPAVARPTDYGRRARALLAELRRQGVHTIHVAAPESSRDGGPDGASAVAPANVSARPHAAADAAPVADGWPHHELHLYRTQTPALPAWFSAAWPLVRGASACAKDAAPCVHVGDRVHAAVTEAMLALRLRRIARLTRPDVLHVHAAPHAGAAWAVARMAHLPVVVEAERRIGPAPQGNHNCTAPGRIERFVCARADALATSSIDMRAALRAAGVRACRIAVMPPAADVPAVPCIDPGPPGLDGAPLLAYAGGLERADGIDLLLAVVLALRRRHPALRLLVAGGGARTEGLEARVMGSSLRGHVIFTGQLSGRRAADALARADIAVFPGLAGSAAALAPPRHLLNAMAQGCAVVASDLAGHRELLVHGHSGMLFPAGSASALLGQLTTLLDERYRLRPLGRAAAAHVGGRHDWPSAAARYRRLYEHVVGARR